ncbi:AAA family ATPase [Belliella marina]|uniref:AAA family ATPase n=1 Tax=Belliella marina TaxID=1644146 RepID=A0ABW4VPI3_9BACT
MKINQIIISNYRAFYTEKGEERTKYIIDLKDGKNMLIYGENGSGKSSFYKGVKDLFYSSIDPSYRLIENVFAKSLELDEQPFIEIAFKENGQPDKTYRFSSDPHRNVVNDEILRSVASARSFMTYRDLLKIHFMSDSAVNLFGFLFESEGLLADLPNPAPSSPETNLKLKDLFQIVKSNPDEVNVKDFVSGVNQTLEDLSTILNSLLKYFDESISVTFPQLTETSIKSGFPVISLKVNYFGVDLSDSTEQYHHFLNEARLSALAICIFLAGHLSVPSPQFKMLFLDDIFTGLDMSNRMPLLDILTDPVIKGTDETFTGHQIFLTTYDRQWYELAKNDMGNSKWYFHEMYIDHHSQEFDHPIWLPAQNDFEKAQYYFKTKQYPACANYQRKICENLIKRFLPDNKKYDSLPNGEIVPVNKLDTFVTKLKLYLEENGLSFIPFIKLRNCLRVVMNPLSHDDFESPIYKKELQLVFEIIDDLKGLKNTILMNAGEKIIMKKTNPSTGLEREYVCELTTPIRRIEHAHGVKIPVFYILPLTQKEGDQRKCKISYGGKFEDIYGMFCHSLGVEKATDPFDDFILNDGSKMNQIFVYNEKT